MNRKIGTPILMVALLATLALMFFVSLTHGSVTIPLKETVNILLGNEADHPTSRHIIWNLRFPRILGGIITGAALAASGMVYQGLFGNVMSDPFVLGISSGAAFSVSLGAYLGIVSGAAGTYVIPLVACAGAMLTKPPHLLHLRRSQKLDHDPAVDRSRAELPALCTDDPFSLPESHPAPCDPSVDDGFVRKQHLDQSGNSHRDKPYRYRSTVLPDP